MRERVLVSSSAKCRRSCRGENRSMAKARHPRIGLWAGRPWRGWRGRIEPDRGLRLEQAQSPRCEHGRNSTLPSLRTERQPAGSVSHRPAVSLKSPESDRQAIEYQPAKGATLAGTTIGGHAAEGWVTEWISEERPA